MRNKNILLFVLGLLLVSFLSNSCKKDTQGTVSSIFTAGNWQLASATITTTTNLVPVTDTLYTKCNLTQVFTFNTDNTCTYTNFGCINQTSIGTWSLSADQLTLNADMTCNDSAGGSSKPFLGAQIYNAGQYSLVLQMGQYNVIPTATNTVKVIRYGFIRQKAAIK